MPQGPSLPGDRLGGLDSVQNRIDDSPDPDTVGFEDPEIPPSGQVFFYVFRGSEGIDAGPGDYGAGTGELERTAGGGDCGQ